MFRKCYQIVAAVLLIACADLILHNSCEAAYYGDCIITPQLWSLEAPDHFNHHSDLRRKAGSAIIAKGQSIIVEGTILDRNCVPVTGSVVKTWQANLGSKSSENDVTTYTGSNISDNLGRFSFYTIMPSPDSDNPSMLHFNVSHPDIIDFETVMLFSKMDIGHKQLNNIDNSLKNLLVAKCINCAKKDEVPIYAFKIVIDGKIDYKNY